MDALIIVIAGLAVVVGYVMGLIGLGPSYELVGAGVTVIGVYGGGVIAATRHFERRIRRWCDQHGCALLDFRHRRSIEGVYYFLRLHPPGERKWRVTAQDGEGGTIEGWVRFGPSLWVDLPWGAVDIRSQ